MEVSEIENNYKENPYSEGIGVVAIQKLNEIASDLPIEVLRDINDRITDWLASGGSDNDPYVEQQLRFAKNFIKATVK